MNTLADLLALEAELTDEARDKYGPYLATALHGCGFLSTGIAKIDDDRFLFGAMLQAGIPDQRMPCWMA